MVDPTEAIETFLFKWVVHVLEPRNSNLLKLFRFQLSQYQPHLGRDGTLTWNGVLQVDHKKAIGSTLWNRVGRAWFKMVKLKFDNPKSPSEILASNFWWNTINHPWDVGFLKSRTAKFHGLGWVSMFDVWVVSKGKLASKEKMSKKFVLSLKKEVGYERIITKLEKVWEGLLRGGDNCCKERHWIGLLEKNNAFLFMVCCASSTFRPKRNNNVQHFYILQDIKLYFVGSQSRTSSLINDGM